MALTKELITLLHNLFADLRTGPSAHIADKHLGFISTVDSSLHLESLSIAKFVPVWIDLVPQKRLRGILHLRLVLDTATLARGLLERIWFEIRVRT